MERGIRSITVTAAQAGLPLDRVLRRGLGDTNRAQVRALFDAGRLRVNAVSPTSHLQPVQEADRLEILPGEPEPALEVLLDDPALVVAWKPAGLACVPFIRLPRRPAARFHHPTPARLVLTLDPPASGVLVAAWQPRAHRSLAAQFAGGGGGCAFLALVTSAVRRGSGPLPGAAGWTYRVVQRFQQHTLVRLQPKRALGARPLAALASAGWGVQSLPGRGAARLALHRGGVSFRHPVTGRAMGVDPSPPDAFRALLDTLQPVAALAAHVPAASPADANSAPAETAPEPALRSPREILKRKAEALPPER